MAAGAALTIVHDALSLSPLAWIHRAEAQGIALELGAHGRGRDVRLETFRGYPPSAAWRRAPLLRLSDPVMRAAARALTAHGVTYRGPAYAALERCYDKYDASRLVRDNGYDTPATALGSASNEIRFPCVVKPRRGSDSLGLRVLEHGPLPAALCHDRYIVQERVAGIELTIALFGSRIGAPLQILLPEGAPYTFARKYFWRPHRSRLADLVLAERVQTVAAAIGALMQVNWAARVDFIFDRSSGRLYFLECDAAPLVGAGSAFAASFEAAGVARAEQLEMLLAD